MFCKSCDFAYSKSDVSLKDPTNSVDAGFSLFGCVFNNKAKIRVFIPQNWQITGISTPQNLLITGISIPQNRQIMGNFGILIL